MSSPVVSPRIGRNWSGSICSFIIRLFLLNGYSCRHDQELARRRQSMNTASTIDTERDEEEERRASRRRSVSFWFIVVVDINLKCRWKRSQKLRIKKAFFFRWTSIVIFFQQRGAQDETMDTGEASDDEDRLRDAKMRRRRVKSIYNYIVRIWDNCFLVRKWWRIQYLQYAEGSSVNDA